MNPDLPILEGSPDVVPSEIFSLSRSRIVVFCEHFSWVVDLYRCTKAYSSSKLHTPSPPALRTSQWLGNRPRWKMPRNRQRQLRCLQGSNWNSTIIWTCSGKRIWGNKRRTKIQDHASNPWVPFICSIPNASRPENAPASVAAPKKRPTRYCSMCRGYHNVKLRVGRKSRFVWNLNGMKRERTSRPHPERVPLRQCRGKRVHPRGRGSWIISISIARELSRR